MSAATWPQVLNWRRERQFLERPGDSTVAVVERLGSIPAVGDRELTVGRRLPPSMPSEVAAAVADGRLVATFTFGGAVHIGTHRQTAALLQLRRTSRQWERPSWRKHYGLEADDWPTFREVVREALAAGPMSMEDLARAIGRSRRFAHVESVFSITLLKALAWHGDLCLTSVGGRSDVRGLVDDPRWPGLPEPDDAARTALRAYLTAFGPAADDQLRYRFGEGLSAGRRLDSWLQALGDDVVPLTVDGIETRCLAEHAPDVLAYEPTDAVDLLAGNDPWTRAIGTAQTAVVPANLRRHATLGTPLVLHAGRVSGTWSLRRHALTIEWLGEGNAPDSRLRAAAADHLKRVESDAAVEIVDRSV